MNVLDNGYSIRKLSREEKVSDFTCGDNDLDDFIINDAVEYADKKLALSYLLKRYDNVLAYFSIANDKVSLFDFDSKTSFNRFRKVRFKNTKRLRGYPSVKICRLAVHSNYRNKRIGSFLLNWIKAYFIRHSRSACRFLLVDAYPDAVPFYEKNGFVHLSEYPDHKRTSLMYFDLEDYKGI